MQSGNLLPVTFWHNEVASFAVSETASHMTRRTFNIFPLPLCFVWIGTRKYNICQHRHFQPDLRGPGNGLSSFGRSVWLQDRNLQVVWISENIAQQSGQPQQFRPETSDNVTGNVAFSRSVPACRGETSTSKPHHSVRGKIDWNCSIGSFNTLMGASRQIEEVGNIFVT